MGNSIVLILSTLTNKLTECVPFHWVLILRQQQACFFVFCFLPPKRKKNSLFSALFCAAFHSPESGRSCLRYFFREHLHGKCAEIFIYGWEILWYITFAIVRLFSQLLRDVRPSRLLYVSFLCMRPFVCLFLLSYFLYCYCSYFFLAKGDANGKTECCDVGGDASSATPVTLAYCYCYFSCLSCCCSSCSFRRTLFFSVSVSVFFCLN